MSDKSVMSCPICEGSKFFLYGYIVKKNDKEIIPNIESCVCCKCGNENSGVDGV